MRQWEKYGPLQYTGIICNTPLSIFLSHMQYKESIEKRERGKIFVKMQILGFLVHTLKAFIHYTYN
jgi:hypothetical protein